MLKSIESEDESEDESDDESDDDDESEDESDDESEDESDDEDKESKLLRITAAEVSLIGEDDDEKSEFVYVGIVSQRGKDDDEKSESVYVVVGKGVSQQSSMVHPLIRHFLYTTNLLPTGQSDLCISSKQYFLTPRTAWAWKHARTSTRDAFIFVFVSLLCVTEGGRTGE